MKKIICLLLLTTSLFGQNFQSNEEYMKRVLNNTQNPNGFIFTDYSKEGNVDISTGRFGTTIPFTTIENEYVSLPISLSYSTSGVKVDENASEIGMGWNLIAGGQITRKMNGSPDDSAINYDVNLYLKKSPDDSPYWGQSREDPLCLKNKFAGSAQPSVSQNYTGIFYYQHHAFNEFYSKYFPLPRIDRHRDYFLNSNNHPMMSILDMLNNNATVENERDVFHVSVGDLNFSFILKLKDSLMSQVNIISDSSKGIITAEEPVYVAEPLDDNTIKIDIIRAYDNFYYTWINGIRTRQNGYYFNFFEGFIITDKKGIKYYFDKYLFTEPQHIRTLSDHSSQSPNGHRTIQFVMQDVEIKNWMLSKIVSPNNETINYSYLKSRITEPKNVPREHDGEYTGFPHNLRPQITPDSYNSIDFEYEKLYIDKISSRNKTVQFNYDENSRIDLQNGKKLKNIQLFDVKNVLIKQFDLVSDYKGVASSNNYLSKRLFLNKLIEKSITNRVNFQYDDSLGGEYIFDYYNPDSLPSKNAIGFQDLYGYYLGNTIENAYPPFPKLYINPDTEGNKISYYPISSTKSITFNGANRIPNANTVHFGAMKKIKFPTRGSLEIEYDSNQFYNTSTIQKNLNGPGCRVENLKYYSQENTLIKNKRYTYELFNLLGASSGELMYKPSYAYISNCVIDNSFNIGVEQNKQYSSGSNELHNIFYKYTTTKEVLNQQGITNLTTLYKKLITTSTHPQGPQSDYFGRDIIYTNVIEEEVSVDNNAISNGKTKYYNYYTDNRTEVNVISGPTDEFPYIAPCDKRVISDQTNSFVPFDTSMGFSSGTTANFPWYFPHVPRELKVKYGFVEKRGKDIFPFPERNCFDNDALKIGKIYKTEFFNDLNVKVQEKNFNYSLINSASYKTSNFKIDYKETYFYYIENNSALRYGPDISSKKPGLYFYTINNLYTKQKMVLSSEETIDYLKTNEFTSKTNYIYNPSNFQLSLQNTTNSQNEILETKYYYPQDLPSEPFVDDLVTKNRVAIPLKSETYKNTEKLSEKIIEYTKTFDNLLLPKYVYANKGNTTIDKITDKKITYDQYDNKGNLLQYTPESGTPVCIIWGYNQTQVVAKLENIALVNIPTALITAIQTATNANTSTEEQVITALNALRTSTDVNLQKAMITTYTHKPLIGVSTITDPKGDKTTYEYDELNRLKQVKDKDGNILNKNEFHYKE